MFLAQVFYTCDLKFNLAKEFENNSEKVSICTCTNSYDAVEDTKLKYIVGMYVQYIIFYVYGLNFLCFVFNTCSFLMWVKNIHLTICSLFSHV